MGKGLRSACLPLRLSLSWMALRAGCLTAETFGDTGGRLAACVLEQVTAKQAHRGGEQPGQQCRQAASPPTEVPPVPSQQQAGSPGVPGAPVIGSLQMAGCLGIYYPSIAFPRGPRCLTLLYLRAGNG